MNFDDLFFELKVHKGIRDYFREYSNRVINLIKPKIEELIHKSGYRKNFIAEKLEVSPRQLRKYETGDSLIPIDKAYILAALIGCKVDDLYERVETDESID